MDEYETECPWCGEAISLVLDLSVASTSYVEDCSVCCRPMLVSVSTEDGELVDLRVDREGD